jgi:predicted fused transcriptional regulator/phosphomethylpyrimidine kinase
MIDEGYKPGKGADVLNFSWNAMTEMPSYFSANEHFAVWLELKKAVDVLLTFLPKEFVPEVGMNIGYALQDAKKLDDICAINGRIVKTKDKPVRYGSIEFGVSKHVASIILAAMKFDCKTRCAMNLKYSDENIEKCKKARFKIGTFDRIQEPHEAKSTMEWGTTKTIQKLGSVPDIIYDTGGNGKEPMIRILGKNPKDVVNKAHILFEKI